MNLEVPEEYKYVLLLAVILAIQCQAIAFTVIPNARRKAFPTKFMEQHFGEEYKKELGKSPPLGGLPDMGCGRFSEKLSFSEWVNFNSAQRVHANFVEQLGVVVVFLVVGGLKYTNAAIALGSCQVLGRLIYTAGYLSGGPNSRFIGVLLTIPSMFGLGFIAVLSCL